MSAGTSPPGLQIRALSIHASYACRHSGACCTAHWPIPVEHDRLPLLRAALADGRLTVATAGPALVAPPDAPDETPALIGTDGQRCVFHDESRRRCRVHGALGHAALPLACRQFPRVTVLDPGGVSLTLSHYCPTAAALLEDDTDAAVVAGPTAFPRDGEYVGLDVREALPPLLAPDMLMDWESWWTWETHAVAHLGRRHVPVGRRLAELSGAVESVRTWTPRDGSLASAVAHAFASPLPRIRRGPDPDSLLDAVLHAVPADIRPRALTRGIETTSRARVHFLAAHAFANWTAHLGRGLRTWLRSLQAADALLTRGLGVRQADLLIRHLADPHVLAKQWSEAEA